MARIIYAGEGCTGCKICSMACVHAHDLVYGLRATRIWVVREEPLTDYPVTCHQCEKPPCKDACPVGAISKRADGLVVVEERACIGCGACVEACPFGAMGMHPTKHVAIKCDLCGGSDPQCVRFCPTKVLKLEVPAAVAQKRRVR